MNKSGNNHSPIRRAAARSARGILLMLVSLPLWLSADRSLQAEPWKLELRYQQPVADGVDRYHRLSRTEQWNPEETAVIVCDVWDLHHCLNAVQRLNQFAPRLNRVLQAAREDGATIIHSPSDCMDAYREHPARSRAIHTPVADNLPEQAPYWCSVIPSEERGVYPIDQSDGGEDDDPREHAQWAAKLAAMGRNPGTPWKKQSSHITIDGERDFISDRGDEVWNILEARGIKNVILTGVHVNMCVLGRPFGLRQMARNGKNVVLMRDMTDAMYNPQRWPYVNHFTGNDLVISHIERHVSPTITSDQIVGGSPFEFSDDHRQHLVIVCAEDEYRTEETLPKFAAKLLGKDFRVSYVWGSAEDRNHLPGLEVLDDADVLLVSVRRRLLPPAAMRRVREFVAAGKPVIGIRTASHAFCLRNGEVPRGFADWPEFDPEVFGGHYTNHHGNQLVAHARVVGENSSHPVLAGMRADSFRTGGSLYKVAPLVAGAQPLLMGKVEGHAEEPVAWTFLRDGGGKSFYTSLGHVDDFAEPAFRQLLVRGIYWAADRDMNEGVFAETSDYWKTVTVPDNQERDGVTWYRCVIRLSDVKSLHVSTDGQAWVNGARVAADGSVPSAAIQPNDANLLVVRSAGGLRQAPQVRWGEASRSLKLAGRWQMRVGDDPAWSNMPLPAKFGAGSDIVFALEDDGR